MLPMRCENRMRPAVQIRMLNNVSALLVLAIIFCPYALHMWNQVMYYYRLHAVEFQHAISNPQEGNKNSKIVPNRICQVKIFLVNKNCIVLEIDIQIIKEKV